ncbi:MAG: hypothetical protein ACOYM7_09710 [Paludibacter sp.]
MILFEKNDKLNEAYQTSRIHLDRMQFAYSKIQTYFPLSMEGYLKITDEELSFFDQFIYRFSKLQDAMGAKLFISVLINLGEDTKGIPFIDIVQRLEKLHIIESAEDWFKLREIRNILTHEYPFHKQEIVDDLNLLFEHYNSMLSVWQQLENYIIDKFSYLITKKPNLF